MWYFVPCVCKGSEIDVGLWLTTLTARKVVYILIPCSTFRETKPSACATTSACPSPTEDSIPNRPSVLSNDVWDPWVGDKDARFGKGASLHEVYA